jgi:hypothetical protein
MVFGLLFWQIFIVSHRIVSNAVNSCYLSQHNYIENWHGDAMRCLHLYVYYQDEICSSKGWKLAKIRICRKKWENKEPNGIFITNNRQSFGPEIILTTVNTCSFLQVNHFLRNKVQSIAMIA